MPINLPRPLGGMFTPKLQVLRLDSPVRDWERFAFVIQADKRGNISVTEFDCHASQLEIAQALCDSNLPDCPVVRVLEGYVGEVLRDVTEDVAREIRKLVEYAADERWSVQNCASQLIRRFDLFDACEEQATCSAGETRP